MKNKNSAQGSQGNAASKSLESDFNEAIDELLKGIGALVMFFFRGFGDFFKLLFRKPLIQIVLQITVYYGLVRFAKTGLHVWAYYEYFPEFAEYFGNLNWVYQYNQYQHGGVFFALYFFFYCVYLGIRGQSLQDKYEVLFLQIGLKNGLGKTPRLITKKKLDKYRTAFLFDSNGLSLEKFKEKESDIASSFDRRVESIDYFKKSRKKILVIFNPKEMPSYITFQELEALHSLKPETFFLGMSSTGAVTQHVGMPHMLISGATGSGKSVSFKGILASLIASPVLEPTKKRTFKEKLLSYLRKKKRAKKPAPPIEVIGIDLKGGLEFTDFKKAPNFKVVKTINGAVSLLEDIEREMMRRFKYLEEKGYKQINPARDGMNRIVVACDEASVLFMERPKHDPNYELVAKARKSIDNICKLSRAALINCIFATQKLDRTIIPTSVSENIEGRLAFRANSEQGSMRVLGSTDAYKLPHNPGRAIWRYGNKLVEIQVPLITTEEIEYRCEAVKEEFENKQKTLIAPQIGVTEKSESLKNKQSYENDIS